MKLEDQIPNGDLIITPVLAENESEMMEASPSNQPTASVRIQLAVSATKFTLASLGEGMQRDCPGYYSVWYKQSPDFSLPPLQPMPALTLSGNIKLQDSSNFGCTILEARRYGIYDVPCVWVQPKQLLLAFPTAGLASVEEDKHTCKGKKKMGMNLENRGT